MEAKKTSTAKIALNFGAILGLVLMLPTLITYVFELYEFEFLNYISYALIAGGVYIGVKKLRDDFRGGTLSYGQGLGFGVLLCFFASIIVGFASYLYLKFIDASFIQFTLNELESGYNEAGNLTDDQVNAALSWSKMVISPLGIFFTSLIGTTLIGLICSLIIAAFTKKDVNSFDEI